MSVPDRIPLISEGQFMQQWIREAGRAEPVLFLSEGSVEISASHPPRAGWRLNIDTKRRLIVRHPREPEGTELATFCGWRNGLKVQRLSENPERPACFLLNGNGFPDTTMQGLQTRLRDRVTGAHGAWNVMVAPYDALHSAGIILETIEPIEITPDSNTNRTHIFERLPTPGRRLPNRATHNVNFDHHQWRFEGADWNSDWTNPQGGGYILQAQWQPPNGTLGWFRVHRANGGRGQISYMEHRLGASVFWAEAANGRHRYISAFDMQENPPMYFLAQLPDDYEVTGYDTALEALAPPIVRELRTGGQSVPRHGDIFFIPTSIGTESFRGDGVVHERRHVGNRVLRRGGAGGGSRYIALPPSRKRNRRVTIFGTGHTADRLIRLEDGRTFVQGTIRHEPYLVPREGDREPEHASIVLQAGVWHLCVRNTVPSA